MSVVSKTLNRLSKGKADPCYSQTNKQLKINKMSSGKVVLGLLAGAAAGALAGILFAPAKGSRTRRRIMRKGENYIGDLKDKLDGLFDKFKGKMEKVKEEVKDYADKKMAHDEASYKAE